MYNRITSRLESWFSPNYQGEGFFFCTTKGHENVFPTCLCCEDPFENTLMTLIHTTSLSNHIWITLKGATFLIATKESVLATRQAGEFCFHIVTRGQYILLSPGIAVECWLSKGWEMVQTRLLLIAKTSLAGQVMISLPLMLYFRSQCKSTDCWKVQNLNFCLDRTTTKKCVRKLTVPKTLTSPQQKPAQE